MTEGEAGVLREIEAVLAAMVPPGWGAAVLRVQDRTAELLPPERALVGDWAPRRVAGFSSGRAAARRALVAAGCDGSAPILQQGRAPLPPAGFRLSITHTDAFAVAVACPKAHADGVGIDLERIDRMDRAFARHIVRPRDRFPSGYGEAELTLAFSLRESVFKALPRDAQAGLAEVDLAWAGERVQLKLRPPSEVKLEHWVGQPGHHVLTMVALGGKNTSYQK